MLTQQAAWLKTTAEKNWHAMLNDIQEAADGVLCGC